MSAPNDSTVDHSKTSSQDAAVAAALRRGADASADPRAVFAAVRDDVGTLVDLRILYGNSAYWTLIGIDASGNVDLSFSFLFPAIDWTQGLAARLFQAMDSGRAYADSGVAVRPQTGPFAGQERVFDVEFAGADDVLSARMRDVTDDAAHVIQQAAAARRTAAIARFLAASVDATIDRSSLLGVLADELARTIGNLCVIVEQDPDGLIVVMAVSGGPAGTAALISATRSSPVLLPEPYRQAFLAGATVLNAPIAVELRDQVIAALRWLGVPNDLAQDVNSTISAAVRRGETPVDRIHLVRFGDDPPMSDDDVATVEAIATTAAVVLERRAVQDRLAASRERFEAVFELAPIAMVAVDGDRTIRYNRRALELYGRDSDEMTRLSFQPGAPWIPPEQVERWEDMRRRVAAGESIQGERLAIIRPSGERREIEGASIQIVTEDGIRGGVVTVQMDLTDQFSLETQLRHAQKMEALGRLAGGIAHDFNNVLMAINGYADFVARDARDGRPVQLAHAEEIVASTRRAIELTARLTAFARRETARVEPVDTALLVRNLLPLVQRLTPASIEIVTRLEPVPLVMVDHSELEQAIVNLVVNAIDAMPDGGRLVVEVGTVEPDSAYVSTHLGALADPQVLLAVSDTGVGMDDVTRSRVFEPFYTTKGVGEGTGLGLAMVFAAVERAKGRIWVYSEPGHGTTFKIYLPPAVAPPVTEDRPVRRDIGGGSESVLLLEDDPAVRDLIATVLRGGGYVVTTAGRPSEALAAAQGRRFDLLVSDMMMPEMTGDLVITRLRLTQPDLRVVLMSGYTATALNFTLGPLDSFVHKPLRPNDVLGVVREILDRPEPA